MENQKEQMYREVYSILKLLGEEYIQKLPKSLYKMIEDQVIQKERIQYASLDEIDENNVLEDSISMIALFHFNYWCESEEEKKELKLLFLENEQRKEEEKRKKYNPEDIFKRSTTKVEEQIQEGQNLPIEKKKETYFTKLIQFFSRIFSNLFQKK